MTQWPLLRAQLLSQWKRLTASELDAANSNHKQIAQLIQCKYGVDSVLVENYLHNFERTPLLANAA